MDSTSPPNWAYPATDPRFSAANNPPGAVGDYAGCVGDMRGTSNNPSTPQWFATTANGAIILGNPSNNNSQFTSNTNMMSISDGTSNTFLAGEKHVPQIGWGHPKVGDGAIYSGAWTTFAGRMAGIEDPLARGPDGPDAERAI